ncbi:MAG: HAD family hydrolase [Candidatus Mcinerneyibacterium aminivorans]|uniref:HAD family hydrolase n=1 Tax=Candidatus Mcinerneyibacterium aminivorans TaxID=2703815 RepID=A0A5D0MLJ6_9BACT|nr:MAG: HAD family hydrolase [Candidatus Mcinerneyibacterium aminivorans]
MIGLIEAVIWDLYGTLFISERGNKVEDPGHHDVLEKGFKAINKRYKVNIDPVEGSKHYKNLEKKLHDKNIKNKDYDINHPELDIRNLWKIFFDTYLNRKITDDKAEEISAFFEKTINPVYLPKENENLLVYLKNNNIKQGILSNSQFYSLELLEDEIENIGEYFDKDLMVLSFREEVGKPDNKIYKVLKKKLRKKKIKPKNCIMVGNDVKNDIEPLKKMGFKTILISTNNQYSEYADYIVNKPRQMYEIFENLIK